MILLTAYDIMKGADHLYNHRGFKIRQVQALGDPSQLTWDVGTGRGDTVLRAQDCVCWRAGPCTTNRREGIYSPKLVGEKILWGATLGPAL